MLSIGEAEANFHMLFRNFPRSQVNCCGFRSPESLAFWMYVYESGMHGAAFFCFGAGQEIFFSGRGRDQNSRGGAFSGQILPGRGIFGAGQKDRKTINQC